MSTEFSLKNLHSSLIEDGYKSQIVPPSEETLHHKLTFSFPSDETDREFRMEITEKEQTLTEIVSEGNFSNLEFLLQLPFNVSDIAVADTARLVCFLNLNLELPGFELDEVEGLLYFRYIYMIDKQRFNEITIQSIIGAIRFYVDTFSSELERCARGKNSMNEIIESLLDKIEEFST